VLCAVAAVLLLFLDPVPVIAGLVVLALAVGLHLLLRPAEISTRGKADEQTTPDVPGDDGRPDDRDDRPGRVRR
jgi:hypothetical protein